MVAPHKATIFLWLIINSSEFTRGNKVMKIYSEENVLIIEGMEDFELNAKFVVKNVDNVNIIYLKNVHTPTLDLRQFKNLVYLKLEDSFLDNIYLNEAVNIQQITMLSSMIDSFSPLNVTEDLKVYLYHSAITHFPRHNKLNKNQLVNVDSIINSKHGVQTTKFIEQKIYINDVKYKFNEKKDVKINNEIFSFYDEKTKTLSLYDSFPYETSKLDVLQNFIANAKNLSIENDFDGKENFLKMNNVENLCLYNFRHRKNLVISQENQLNSLFISNCDFGQLDLADIKLENPIILDDSFIDELCVDIKSTLEFKIFNSEIKTLYFVEGIEVFDIKELKEQFIKNNYKYWIPKKKKFKN